MSGRDKKQLLWIWGLAILCWTIAIVAFNIYVNSPPASAAPMSEADMPQRIPFTNKPVTPGDPESYIGTYGQCPFYENAMERGCFPPSDIKCNADWSKCDYVGTTWTPETTVSEPTATNSTNTQQSPQNVTSTPKTTNTKSFGGGGASGNIESNEIVNNDENQPKTANIAEKSQKSPELEETRNESNYALPLTASIFAVIGSIGFAVWRYRHMS